MYNAVFGVAYPPPGYAGAVPEPADESPMLLPPPTPTKTAAQSPQYEPGDGIHRPEPDATTSVSSPATDEPWPRRKARMPDQDACLDGPADNDKCVRLPEE